MKGIPRAPAVQQAYQSKGNRRALGSSSDVFTRANGKLADQPLCLEIMRENTVLSESLG